MEGYKENFQNGNAAKQLDLFLKLPHRAQELLFAVYNNPEMAHCVSEWNLIGEWLLQYTPTEMLFLIAFDIVREARLEDVPPELRREPLKELSDEEFAKVVIAGAVLDARPTISAGSKCYAANFLFDADNTVFADWLNPLKVAIECDWCAFPEKPKEQVEHAKEKELDLKNAGYDLIRFSGNQLYDDPIGCAKKAYAYIANKLIEKGVVKWR